MNTMSKKIEDTLCTRALSFCLPRCHPSSIQQQAALDERCLEDLERSLHLTPGQVRGHGSGGGGGGGGVGVGVYSHDSNAEDRDLPSFTPPQHTHTHTLSLTHGTVTAHDHYTHDR